MALYCFPFKAYGGVFSFFDCSYLTDIIVEPVNQIKDFFQQLSNIWTFYKRHTENIYLQKEPNLKYILKTSMIILITAESACILTAETIGIVLYNYSILLGISLALIFYFNCSHYIEC